MKVSISLEKDRIKLKGDGKKVIVSIYPSHEKPWKEPIENEGDIRRLYQIMENHEDSIEPNEYGEIHLGSPMSVRQNFASKLYKWNIENNESHARDYNSIEIIPRRSIRTCFTISIIPKIFEIKTRDYPTLVSTNVELI